MERAWSCFTDNLEVIGFIVGVLGILLAIYYGRQGRRAHQKTIDYVVRTDEHILAATEDLAESGLTIELGTIPLKHPRIIGLRLINTGSREIMRSEYQVPITISVESKAIVSAAVTGVSDPSVYKVGLVKEALESYQAKSFSEISEWELAPVELRPKLLNPNEWIDLQLVVDAVLTDRRKNEDEEDPPIEVAARFAGQSRPVKSYTIPPENHRRDADFLGLGLCAGIALAFLVHHTFEWI